MTTRLEMNRSLTLALTALLWGVSHGLLRGQTLMTEPLGDPTEPTMSLFVTTLPPGYDGPTHQHAGVVFIYVLEGEIESQVEPDPPKIYRAGDFFHERPKQTHRVFRNLSKSARARFVNFSNIATPNLRPEGSGAKNTAPQNPGSVSARLLLQERLADLANQEVSVVKITSAPAATTGAHQHPGPIFAYLLKGEVESQVDPGEPQVYRAGEMFYEPPMHTHRIYRNLSKTEPAELLVFHVREKGKSLSVGAK